jgi:hypothetical protein
MTVKQKESCIGFVLLPLKAFVVFAVPLYFLFRVFFPKPLLTYIGNNTTVMDPTAQVLLGIFACCGPVLLCGALAQFLMHRHRPAAITILFGLVPSLVFACFFFVWVVAHLL